MRAQLRRAWDWCDDHLTKILAAIGANLVVGDVVGYAEPLRELLGESGYKVILGLTFGALFLRGWVTGKRGEALEQLAMRPPDIP